MTTYQELLTAQSLTDIEADLLEAISANGGEAGVVGWPAESPQRKLLAAVADQIREFQVQRVCVAAAISTAQLRELRDTLVSLGVAADSAAELASSFVDVALENAGLTRIEAIASVWDVAVTVTVAAAPVTIDSSTNGLAQAADGTYFEIAQEVPVTLGAPSYTGTVRLRSNDPGAVGNVPEGTILALKGPAGVAIDPSGDQSLYVVGRDRETDSQALTRVEGTRGAGGAVLTAAAWKTLILTGVPTLTQVFVDDAAPYGPASVGLALANATGGASATEVTSAQAIADLHEPAAGGHAVCVSAAENVVAVSAVLKTTQADKAVAAAQAVSTLEQLGATIEGAWLYVDAVTHALMSLPGAVDVQSLSLANDVQRGTAEVFVIDAEVTCV